METSSHTAGTREKTDAGTPVVSPAARVPCVHTLIERQVGNTPDAKAVLCRGRAISYRELNDRAGRLSRMLRQRRIRPEAIVALCMDYSEEFLVALLGIWKAGAAYVPLDPDYPEERLRFMIVDAGATLLITTRGLQPGIEALCEHTLFWDELSLETGPFEGYSCQPHPDSAAYVIYTSGTTGRPKGVVISHAALTRTLASAVDRYQIRFDDRMLAVASVSFDIFLFETLLMLLGGGATELLPREDLLDLNLTLQALERTTVFHAVPGLMRTILGDSRAVSAGARLRAVFVGGEEVSSALRRTLCDTWPQARIEVLFGPTETAIICLRQPLDPHAEVYPNLIGTPLKAMTRYVMNPAGVPVPVGVVGELYLGGPCLARGYLNRPDLTAERFVADPFGRIPGARLYRTGDLARFTTEGALEFAGRVDDQVKIRGYRIELAEIQAALECHPRIREAALCVSGENTDKWLVAYFVVRDEAVGSKELREHLRARLPHYMIPGAFVTLPALPRTRNGKLDRKALPAPSASRDEEYQPPRTPNEEILCALFAEILDADQVGIEDDFFQLGGHSLMATRLVSRIRTTLGREVPIRRIFESPRVRELSGWLQQAGGGAPPVKAEARPARLPLSYAQQRLWFLDQLQGSSVEYNIPEALRLSGKLDVEALRGTINTIVERHESLRTCFEEIDGEPVQMIAPELEIGVEVEDLSALEGEQRRAAVQAAVRREAEQGFDLRRGPLLRMRVLRLGAEEHILLRTTHHIVSDGWSQGVFNREFQTLYGAYAGGEENPLPPLEVQYGDFTLWQRRRLEGEAMEAGLQYWKEALAGIPERLELPADRVRPPVQSFAAEVCQSRLSGEQLQSLQRLSRQNQATLYMTLLAGFALLLNRYSGQEDIVIGSPVANRQDPQLENLIGFFVNSLVMRVRVDAGATVEHLLAAVRHTALEAYRHQDVPFERLVELLAPQRRLSSTPVFQVAFSLQNAPWRAPELAGLSISPIVPTNHLVPFDLSVHAVEWGGELELIWLYQSGLFDRWRMEQMSRHFIRLLDQMAAGPNLPLLRISLLDPEECHRLIEQGSGTREKVPETTLHGLFERQCAMTPERIALEFEGTNLRYAELNAAANQLARYLIDLGVSRRRVVVVAMDRSADWIVSLLAILKTGGTYCPVDSTYPEQRVRFLIEQARPVCVLTTTARLASLPRGETPLIAVDRPELQRILEAQLASNIRDSAPLRPVQAEDSAYLLYTSGSTGQPKGVLMSHKAIVNKIVTMIPYLGAGSTTRYAVSTSISFDPVLEQIFCPLCSGGTCVIVSEHLRLDPIGFQDYIQSHDVSIVHGTPAMIERLLCGTPAGARLDAVIIGGDVVPVTLAARLRESHPVVRIFNLYGPTEICLDATGFEIGAGPFTRPVPIGVPLANYRLYALDRDLQPVPGGVAGELYVAGVGLAEGYLNRPELTCERFLADPWGEPGTRMYRTGDLARWLPDRNLEFLGRTDDQVKVAGFRIETREIEAALLQQPDIADAAVIVKESRAGEMRLAAYVVPASGHHSDIPRWRSRLAEMLPEYMVPASFVELSKLPLTVNGKLDRAALPELALPSSVGWRGPQTAVQETLCASFAQLLGVEKVSIDDNFFELGGDSIVSIRLVNRVRQAGLLITPRDVFQQQTVAALALIARKLEPVTTAPVQDDPGKLPGTPLMLSLQERRAPVRRFAQAVLLEVPPRLGEAELARSFDAVLRRHGALRSRLKRADDGTWELEVEPAGSLRPEGLVRRVDATALPDTELRQNIAAGARDAVRRLNPEAGGMVQSVWFDRGDADAGRLLIAVHHLAMDGVSWSIMLPDLKAAWNASAKEESPKLSRSGESFRSWTSRLHTEAVTPRRARELDYWQKVLREPVAFLPGQVLSTARDNVGSAGYLNLLLDSAATTQLFTKVVSVLHARVNELLLTALAIAALRWLRRRGQISDSAVINLESHGREENLFEGTDVSRTIGWFTSVFPVRLDLSGVDIDDAWAGGPAIGKALKTIKEQLAAVPDGGIGYGLLRYLNPATAAVLRELPAPQIGFNYLGRLDTLQTGDWPLAPEADVVTGMVDANMPLANCIEVNAVTLPTVDGPCLRASWTWARAMLPEADVSELAEGWFHALRTLSEHATREGAGGHTPSDFPLVKLTQSQLEQVESRYPRLEDLLPLAPLQDGLLFHAIYDAASHDVYTGQLILSLEGDFDESRFECAVRVLLGRHGNLRAAFYHSGDLPAIQIIPSEFSVPWIHTDLSLLSDREQQGREREIVTEDRRQPFDVEAPPLVRFHCIRLGPGRHRLIMTTHHILVDGWSMPIVIRELFEIYRQNGATSGLASVTPFRDYLGWLLQLDRETMRSVWQTELSGLDEATLVAPSYIHAPAVVPESVEIRLPEALTAAMTRLARASSLTLNTLVQGAWGILLSRLTGREDIVFGVTVSGRPPELPGIETMVGLLINTLPLRIQIEPDVPVIGELKHLQDRQSRLVPYQYLSVVEIQKLTGLSALFDTLVVFENYPVGSHPPAAEPRPLRIAAAEGHDATHYPLTLTAAPGARLGLKVSYRPDVFDCDQANVILARIVRVLETIVKNPSVHFGRVDVLDRDERRQLLERWNCLESTATQALVPDLFDQQTRKTPAHIAIEDRDRVISYSELNHAANGLANYLSGRGIGTDQLIAVALTPSAEAVIAMLGILKAGAAYLPLDIESPPDRTGRILAEARPRLAIVSGETASLVGDLEKLHIDAPEFGAGRSGTVAIASARGAILAEQLAYVIYTSGSTGSPKGVGIAHGALAHYLLWAREAYKPVAGGATPLNLPVFFDAAVTSIFLPLISGQRIVIAGGPQPLQVLAGLLSSRRDLSLVKVTPAGLQGIEALLGSGASAVNGVRIIVGGEMLPWSTAAFWQDNAGVNVVNEYGPTEATVGCCTFDARTFHPRSESVPIGMPAAGVRLYALGVHLEPVPLGVPGELYISSPGLARGYMWHPALTAARFVADPYGTPGARMYRTGDLVVRHSDGNLEFLGRTDRQVKIRGYRVETGEIDACLRNHPFVQDALTLARADSSGLKRLASYVIARNGSPRDPALLKSHVGQNFPEYMLPATISILDSWPLNRHGKIDRGVLLDHEETTHSERHPVTSPIERTICTLFAGILDRPEIRPDGNFFELGGHSLLAARVVSAIRQKLGVEISIRMVFELPTPRELAAHLPAGKSSALRLAPGVRPDPIPASFAQRRLWFLDRLGEAGTEYNVPVALFLRGTLDADALHRALRTIVARHESLRTHFVEIDGEPFQAIEPELHLAMPVEDLSVLDPRQQEIRLDDALRAERDTPFDLARGPVLRVRLLRMGPQTHVVQWTMHHIVSDAWSQARFNRELTTLYEAFLDGRENPLQPLPLQYTDFALWQIESFGQGALDEALAYWSRKLAGLPESLGLAADRPWPAAPLFLAGACYMRLSPAQTAALGRLGNSVRATPFMTLLAVLDVLIWRYTGQQDIVIGTSIANRQDAQLDDLIGFFINKLLLRSQVSPEMTFQSLLRQVRDTCIEAYQHQDLPFEKLMRELSPQRRTGGAPLYQVSFTFQNAPAVPLQLRGLETEPASRAPLQVRTDLELHAFEIDGTLCVNWLYARERFDPWRIEQMQQHYRRLLEQILANPLLPVGRVHLTDAEESRRIIGQFNHDAALPRASVAHN